MWQDAEYTDRLVCFVDILGFKELVERSANPDLHESFILGDDRPKNAKDLCAIFDSLLHLLQMHKDEHYTPESDRYKELLKYRTPVFVKGDMPDFQFGIFSDCIVFSVNRLSVGTMMLFCSMVETITSVLFESSTTCRGGISWGKCFHKDNVIFGPAMTEAYTIEQKTVYPRVIINPDIMPKLAASSGADDLSAFWISKDDDSQFFIDIIKHYDGCPEYNYYVMQFTHGMHWLLNLNLNHPDLKVRDKYNWYRPRFNNLLKKVKKFVKEDCPDRDYREEFLALPYFK